MKHYTIHCLYPKLSVGRVVYLYPFFRWFNELFSFSLTWDPMAVNILIRYSSHNLWILFNQHFPEALCGSRQTVSDRNFEFQISIF